MPVKIHHVRQIEPGHCLAACVAMVCGESLETVLRETSLRKSILATDTSDQSVKYLSYLPLNEAIKFLASRMLQWGISVGRFEAKLTADVDGVQCNVPLSYPAIVTVSSENLEAKLHAVVWDSSTRKVLDPLYDEPRRIEQYQIIEWAPILEFGEYADSMELVWPNVNIQTSSLRWADKWLGGQEGGEPFDALVSIGKPANEEHCSLRATRNLLVDFYDVTPTNPKGHPLPEASHIELLLNFARGGSNGERVLIHCKMGRSRSTACAVLYYMAKGVPACGAVSKVIACCQKAKMNWYILALGDAILRTNALGYCRDNGIPLKN